MWISLKSNKAKKTKGTVEEEVIQPVKPTVVCNKDSIILNGKKHNLPTTKEYLLKEYKDVFSGIGTLPGGPYHIQLKENYTAVQHAPCQVAVSLKSAYKAEHTEVNGCRYNYRSSQHTEVDPLNSPSEETRWKFKTMSRS